jgi:uncharacterized membrane protein YhhN
VVVVLSFLAFLAFAVADWVAVSREQKEFEYVAKPAVLAALLIYATTGADPSGWLIAALALSLLGDVYLMLPANLFAAGLAAFLLAHVSYIAAFDASWTARIIWLAVVLGASSPVALRVLRSMDDPTLRPAVVIYLVTIALMVASACASGMLTAAVGAVLFFVSDGIIAWDRFVQKLPRSHLAIMVTYHLGQLLLVIALRGG